MQTKNRAVNHQNQRAGRQPGDGYCGVEVQLPKDMVSQMLIDVVVAVWRDMVGGFCIRGSGKLMLLRGFG